ncbi:MULTISPECIES: hypothetical protein [Actinomadura]|uniref:DUF3040 domain-containing protein n=2 Tax=Actinomadura TaxID=1988 RepID=A0A5D0UG28_9ACTN|nr:MULTISPECIES: hypothetical protein [Actinomadura]TYC16079.1 hypothetical protein FXF65_12220 [Actinomadura syzygii]TYK43968.1 hypothetical protein FXF68_35175 [Actinomadura decatromicini]
MNDTEDRLRDALDALAGGVTPDPDAYPRVRREWRRRERRRRLVLYILIAVIFTAADAIGLWALNHAHNRPHVIFSVEDSATPRPAPPIGPS